MLNRLRSIGYTTDFRTPATTLRAITSEEAPTAGPLTITKNIYYHLFYIMAR